MLTDEQAEVTVGELIDFVAAPEEYTGSKREKILEAAFDALLHEWMERGRRLRRQAEIDAGGQRC
jgi:hypothetical protein